jgi:large subunit ribosomal protein L14
MQKKTIFTITDNSGVKYAKCIRVNKITNKLSLMGSVVIISVKSIKSQSKIKIGSVYRALIVRSKLKFQRLSGQSMLFCENAAILLNQKNELVSTRIFGPVSKELRKRKLLKILCLATDII